MRQKNENAMLIPLDNTSGLLGSIAIAFVSLYDISVVEFRHRISDAEKDIPKAKEIIDEIIRQNEKRVRKKITRNKILLRSGIFLVAMSFLIDTIFDKSGFETGCLCFVGFFN